MFTRCPFQLLPIQKSWRTGPVLHEFGTALPPIQLLSVFRRHVKNPYVYSAHTSIVETVALFNPAMDYRRQIPCGRVPVSQKSRNFSGVFRVTWIPLYLQKRNFQKRLENLQIFCSFWSWKYVIGPASQDKRIIVWKLASRVRKRFAAFEKRGSRRL